MEDRLQAGFQRQCDHGLCDPVSHRGHAQQAYPRVVLLGDFHPPYRRRAPGSLRHSIPYFLHIVDQISLEVLDFLLVHSRSTIVLLDLVVRLPYQLFRDLERFRFYFVRTCLAHSTPPRAQIAPVVRANNSQMSRPLRSTPITGASSLLRTGPPARPQRYSIPHLFSCLPPSLSPPPPIPQGGAVSSRPSPRPTQNPQTRLPPPPCRTPPGQEPGPPPDSSRNSFTTPVLMSVHSLDTSAVDRFRSSSWSPSDTLWDAFSSTAQHNSLQLMHREVI